MNYIDVTEFGGPEMMALAVTEKPVASEGQLVVKVMAAGINRADILQRQGKYPPPKGESPIMGLEVCGEVVESSDEQMLGKKVFGLVAGGAYAEYCVLDAAMAFELPENLSVEQGAVIAEVFLTAYQAMFSIGQLQGGQKVLIHAGASGVGTAAIQLAKQAGAEVFVTVGSTDKAEFCRKLGADHCINYQEEDFVTEVKQISPGGIDLVVDCIAGEYISKDINCMSMDGKIVVLAIMGGRFVEMFDMAKMLGKRISLTASTLRNRSSDYKAQLVADFKRDFFERFATGQLIPVIDSVYDWKDVADAHRYIEGNHNKGKVILTVGQ